MSTQSGMGIVMLMLALLFLASCANSQRPPAEIQRDWCNDVGQEKCR
jgi:Na+-transporting methylmalonyl-CoA/oxaloacetate decarboxylase gamma subunit